MKKLKILLYADSFKEHVGQTSPYYKFFKRFGEVILITAHNDLNFFIEHGDVLALPGGLDVDPSRYSDIPAIDGSRINPHYEYLDKKLLAPWLDTGKPVVGICRGMQTLNVSLGGTLYPDIYGHRYSGDNRSNNNKDMTVLSQYAPPDERDKLPISHFHINSYHHQSVAKMADGFKMIGWGAAFRACPSLDSEVEPPVREIMESDNRGNVSLAKSKYSVIVEAMIHKTKPYVAFQYHPEEFDCEFAIYNINNVLNNYYADKNKKGGFLTTKKEASKV